MITHNFLQHLQLVLHTVSLNLLFLHKLVLWLLANYDRSAKLLRLSKVLAFRNRLVGLCGTSDFAIRNFQRFLGSLCHVVVVKRGLVYSKGTCVYLVDNNRIFHRLELRGQIDQIVCFGRVVDFDFTLEN